MANQNGGNEEQDDSQQNSQREGLGAGRVKGHNHANPVSRDGTQDTEANGEPANQSSFTGRLLRDFKLTDWITAVSTVVIAILTAVYVVYSRGQLQAMQGQWDQAKNQVAMMQRQIEGADRPWIKVITAKPIHDLNFAMMQTESTVGAMIIVTVKNIGKSVALNVTLHARMTLIEDSNTLGREESDACSGGVTVPRVVTVFPDDDTQDSLFVVGVATIPSKIDPPAVSIMNAPFLVPNDSKLISPKLVGCVSYTYPSSPGLHHSGFRFALEYGEILPKGSRPDVMTTMLFKNHQPHYVRYFVVGKDIPNSQLRMERFFSGFDAD